MRLSKHQTKELKLVRKVFGIFLILVGIAGIILPILPGWILIFIGLGLLGIQIYYVERIKKYVRKKINRKNQI
ncbi:MAG: PGPGW domain-containing protein [bacterium]